jgi:hypothetical protein
MDVTDSVHERLIRLPLHLRLEDDAEAVISAVREAVLEKAG